MRDAAYRIVELEQGTPDWHAWRRQGLGASDAPVIMGENPWKTRSQLLEDKCGFVRDRAPNAAMMRGTALEPEARRRFAEVVGTPVVPVCVEQRDDPWLRASVDGLAPDGSLVVEIKCGQSVYTSTAATRCVPNYYRGQLQHILAVTGLPSIEFWCFLPGRPELHLSIARDDLYIARLLEAEYTFWQAVRGRVTSV